MNSRSIFRFIAIILGIFIFQKMLIFILGEIGLSGLSLIIVLELIMAFLFAYIYYPAPYRKQCFKDPSYHKNVAIFFGIFMILQLLF
ncbi:MAG: hypothetical protein VB122_08145 [Erysipelotrichales bacterium]|nr:hypothetical protein [Bacilli bacterium]MEA4822175.1 hypothetical protein [Erysipelotrichales bacterium]